MGHDRFSMIPYADALSLDEFVNATSRRYIDGIFRRASKAFLPNLLVLFISPLLDIQALT